ncbi:MAG: hypothetical protein ACI865_002926 [Flavobacteriaceae bacterium]|jgi:hypothetical protein
MKIFATITTLFISGMIFSQNSYYFKDPVPSMERKVDRVDTKYYGKYQDSKTLAIYEFTADGVYIISINMTSIPKKVVRESSSYSVRDGLIHGVVAGDSIPCALTKGVYYFGVRNREAVVYDGSMTKLTKVSEGQYILNFYENGGFIPVKLNFRSSEVTLSDFDYDQDQTPFAFIEEQTSTSGELQNQILLAPSEEEFARINTSTHFVQRSPMEEYSE